MARVLSKEETLIELEKQYKLKSEALTALGNQINALRAYFPAKTTSVPSLLAPAPVAPVEDLSKLSPVERVLRSRPDFAGFKKELEATGLKTEVEIMAMAAKLDREASKKSGEASEKATAATATTRVVQRPVETFSPGKTATIAMTATPVKPAVPLTPLEACLTARPDLAEFKKELTEAAKDSKATMDTLMALAAKLDKEKVSGGKTVVAPTSRK